MAKFQSSEIKTLDNLTIGEYNTLVLEGTDIFCDSFYGVQDILVIQVEAQGKK